MGLKAAIAANAMATIRSLDYFNADPVLSTPVSAGSEVCEGSVLAECWPDITVGRVTLVEHDSVLAALGAAILRGADAFGLVVVEVW